MQTCIDGYIIITLSFGWAFPTKNYHLLPNLTAPLMHKIHDNLINTHSGVARNSQ